MNRINTRVSINDIIKMSYNNMLFVGLIISMETNWEKTRGEREINDEMIGWEKEYFFVFVEIFFQRQKVITRFPFIHFHVSYATSSRQFSPCYILMKRSNELHILRCSLVPTRYFIAAFLLIGENISYNEILDCERRSSKVFKNYTPFNFVFLRSIVENHI